MAVEAETETKGGENATATVEEPKKVIEEETKTEEAKEEKDTKKDDAKKKEKPATKEPAPPKPTVHKVDFEKDVVYLYQFSRTSLLPSLSPFCLKTETWLRVNKVNYENVDHKMRYRSKKGLLPFVELNGEEINDSANIIKELGKRFDMDLDKNLTTEQHVLAHTTCSMIENHLYWVLYWWRSKYPGRFLKGSQFNMQEALGSRIPKPVLDFVFKLRFRQGQKRVRAHGLGVHSAEEIEEFGRSDLQTLSELLGEKEYFFPGTEPTLLDITAFSVLAQFIYFETKDAPFPLHDWLQENCKNLQNFVERMKDRFYPDWKEMCETLDLNTHKPKPPPEEKKEEEKKEEDKKTEDKKQEEPAAPKEEAKNEVEKKD
ncbi:unnamed protein product [Cyprideis torosa]|uniref:Uncharacterized protein n=1 Tax=Cyprideis torosa TaxID=163714 RepID=A0A7R8ZQI8_9CRUS|nr:unnamed protein product [Cyprideis torosa]CAG0892145.1 unnamed protein product [Cyprideis torosa]